MNASILERMEGLFEELKGQPAYAGCLPFLHTYTLVTKNIMALHQESMGQLDAVFAQMYFDPLKSYLHNQAVAAPWQECYNYNVTENFDPLLAIMLGANAHINGDLPVALALTQFQTERDFMATEQALALALRQMMIFLVRQYHHPFALVGLIVSPLPQHFFHNFIIRWRRQAWLNAQKITVENLVNQRQKLNSHTEQIARELISHGFRARLEPIRL